MMTHITCVLPDDETRNCFFLDDDNSERFVPYMKQRVLVSSGGFTHVTLFFFEDDTHDVFLVEDAHMICLF